MVVREREREREIVKGRFVNVRERKREIIVEMVDGERGGGIELG